MKETIHVFKTEDRELSLDYTLWYRNASGGSSSRNGTVENHSSTAENQRDWVLTHQTSFVKANWYRMEVSIPQRGGDGLSTWGRLLITREPLEKTNG